MSIRSRVPSETYKQEWERIFGQKKQSSVGEQGDAGIARESTEGNQKDEEISEVYAGSHCSVEAG